MARYRSAFFLKIAQVLSQAPDDTGAEVAFIGRSNAGKSSVINALTGQRALARTSKTPGRTQLLQFFSVADAERLVDLPGYGYARVAESLRAQWQNNLSDYLQRRQSLRGVIVVMDIRHPLTVLDKQMLEFCTGLALPARILLTKADKLKRSPAHAVLRHTRAQLAQLAYPVETQLFSSSDAIGVAELEAALDNWFKKSLVDSRPS